MTARPPRRQPTRDSVRWRSFDPGPWSRWDLVSVLLYVGLLISGISALLTGSAAFQNYFASPAYAAFAANLLIYTALFAAAIMACFTAFKDSLRTFRRSPWLKAGMLPALWLGSALLSTGLVYLLGGPVKSENQLAVEGLTTAIPFLPMMVMAGLLGPFVEEYIFRHLLIGKLSRVLNVWVCAGISAALFAGLHFLGGGSVEPVAVVPYLVVGMVISLAYVLTGRSLAYAYSLHVLNNLVALVVTYTLAPLLGS